jgi:membrane-associated protease RseP (regulator of RpoE activity)
MEQFRHDRPIHPQGSLKRTLERVGGAIVLIGGTALKWGFIFVKFFGFFISVAAYSLWFHSWTFAFGFVVLILIHELGHVAAARSQGIRVSWPTFIPFFGAYVTVERAGLTPWKNALVSLAGPFTGGAASLLVWGVGAVQGSHQLEVLANIGFLLNAFNMLPIGCLDGGQTVQAAREAWRMPRIQFADGVPVQAFAPDRARALTIWALYVGIATVLVIGMLATKPNGAL